MFKLSWIAATLRDIGLQPHEVPGWQTMGHRDVQGFKGIVVHHTACGGHGDILDLDILEHGRPDLAGPLCNIAIGRLGTVVTVAAGVAYHAGSGDGWYNIDPNTANDWTIGIEAENLGDGSDPWPDAELRAMYMTCAALLDYGKLPTCMCFGHKEWTTRKIDPVFGVPKMNMDDFRARVETFRRLKIANFPDSENQ